MTSLDQNAILKEKKNLAELNGKEIMDYVLHRQKSQDTKFDRQINAVCELQPPK